MSRVGHADYDSATQAVRVGFAGMMIAVNDFSSTLGVEVDKDLGRFLPSLSAAADPSWTANADGTA